MSAEHKILYLCQDDVKQACAEIDSVSVMREVFLLHTNNQTVLPEEAYLSWENNRHELVRSLNMPGYVGGTMHMAGTKIINSNIRNPDRGLPRASGLTLLFDDTSVHVKCIMDSAYLSSLRTASVTALAIKVSEGATITCACVIGLGVLAQAHIEQMLKVLPQLRNIYVYDTNAGKAYTIRDAFAVALTEHSIMLHIASSAEEAIRPAQLIVCTTTVTRGYVLYQWLRPGAFLANVSLDDPLPDVVFKADRVVVDDWHLVKCDTRRLLGRMYDSGQLVGPNDPVSLPSSLSGQCRRVDAQLGEIVSGAKKVRMHNDEIILFNPFGLAIEDVALASHVYQIACQRQLGVWLHP